MLPKITVLLPCKNEVNNLSACIASARLVADEVLVADSGSTDGTLELAHELADRVIEREYIDSGDFKNWAIPQCSNRWVFVLDADERITSELAEEIQLRLADSSQTELAYSIPRLNYFLGYPLRYGDWSRDCVTRLMQRDQCRYKLHTDHSEIEVPRANLGKLQNKLTHYTAWDPHEYLKKQTHYAEQQAHVWHKQGRRPELIHVTLNPPMRFLRGYVGRLGFLDGMMGFIVASMTAYYSFLKQFLLWQLWNGRTLEDVEPSYAASTSRGEDEVFSAEMSEAA